MIRSLTTIPQLRLHNQCITRARYRQVADLVAWLGAVQAQEFGPAKWALGLRLPPTSTDAAVEKGWLDTAVARYSRFRGEPVTVSISK